MLMDQTGSQMNPEDWGTFLSGLGTLIIALVGIAILAYDVRLRRRQLRENRSRSYATLNVDFQVSVHPKLDIRSGKSDEWILESRVILKNASSEIFAVPAVYIYAHALPETDGSFAPHAFSEGDFDQLSRIGQLSEPKNVAWFRSGIWHLGPDEVDSVVRWDVVSADLIREHPVIIVRAVVYSVPNDLVGAAYSPGSAATADRTEWTEFMEREEGARHKKVIFSHSPKNVEGIRQGDWIFLKTDSDEVDIEASKRFRRTLIRFCQTGRQNLVVLSSSVPKMTEGKNT
jgi:hypothetical protein